jgi:hypothetical protein
MLESKEVTVKPSIILCSGLLLLWAGFAALTPAHTQEPAAADGGIDSRSFFLSHLLSGGTAEIDAAISQISGAPALQRAEAQTMRAAFALGVLYQYRYLRTNQKEDAFHSLDLLRRSRSTYGQEALHRVHLGMAYASASRIKQMFGGGELKQMWKVFDSIPPNHSDWLVRFLRGTTLTELGMALPNIIFVAGDKRRALSRGREELRFVQQASEREEAAVPRQIAERSLSLLQRSK